MVSRLVGTLEDYPAPSPPHATLEDVDSDLRATLAEEGLELAGSLTRAELERAEVAFADDSYPIDVPRGLSPDQAARLEELEKLVPRAQLRGVVALMSALESAFPAVRLVLAFQA